MEFFTPARKGPQKGGLVSPALSNIYLHYVLDLWFEKSYARACRGKAHLVRYADDYVACFQYEEDARGFLAAMTERLEAFDLEVEPSKTAMLRFGSAAHRHCPKDGLRRPLTFRFLGFEHFVSCSRKGCFVVGRKTEGKRFRKKLKALNQRLRALRVKGGTAMLAFMQRHLAGHIQYYGVSGNVRYVTSYVYFATRLLYKWLNRRSQRRSLNWRRFCEVVVPRLPRGRIVHGLYPVPLWRTQTGSRMV